MGLLTSLRTSFRSLFRKPHIDGSSVEQTQKPLRERVSEVSIFINEARKIEKAEPPRARIDNFRPRRNKETGRLEKSSFCIDEMREPDCWQMLSNASTVRPVLGRADLHALDILEAELSLEANWVPERHVDLIGWREDHAQETSSLMHLLKCHRFKPKP